MDSLDRGLIAETLFAATVSDSQTFPMKSLPDVLCPSALPLPKTTEVMEFLLSVHDKDLKSQAELRTQPQLRTNSTQTANRITNKRAFLILFRMRLFCLQLEAFYLQLDFSLIIDNCRLLLTIGACLLTVGKCV